MGQKIFRISAFVALTSVFAISTWAQSYTGGLRGLVVDGAGGLVAGIEIQLIDEGTGVPRLTQSNAAGEYVFSSLNPATYSLIVEPPAGFKKFERKGLTVATQQSLTVDVRLEVGQVNESVVVSEEVPLIETSNASNGQVLDAQKMTDLPNLGRNPFLLSKLSTNVVPAGDPRFNRFQDQSGSRRSPLPAARCAGITTPSTAFRSPTRTIAR